MHSDEGGETVGREKQEPGSDRRGELVRIAFRQIANKGFEGLRVREVAQEAGINNATLHYYFPSKEALIGEVVQFVLRQFQSSALPRPPAGEHSQNPSALDRLRLEFEDLRFRFRETPEVFIVLTELTVRSHRDPAIASALQMLDRYWHAYLVSLLDQGVGEGVFRSDLDLGDAARMIMTELKAVGFQSVSSQDAGEIDRLIDLLADQAVRWLLP
jgi:AcrR family transcriptional regulator